LVTFLEEHKKFNSLINENVTREEFLQARKEKDASLKPPRLIPHSIKVRKKKDNKKTWHICKTNVFYLLSLFV
jgi:hypothetical protein